MISIKKTLTVVAIFLTLESVEAQQTAKISGQITGANITTQLTKDYYRVTLQCIDSSNYIQTTFVSETGQYSFDAVKGKSYKIWLNDIDNGTKNPNNGVSTLDLVMTQKHILGISKLEQKYSIAADVNLDGRVTASDNLEMRKLILGITTQFPAGKSWIYRSDKNKESESIVVFPFPLLGDLTQQNFIAIKLGDVNGTAIFH
jgi:hypothetical protein